MKNKLILRKCMNSTGHMNQYAGVDIYIPDKIHNRSIKSEKLASITEIEK